MPTIIAHGKPMVWANLWLGVRIHREAPASGGRGLQEARIRARFSSRWQSSREFAALLRFSLLNRRPQFFHRMNVTEFYVK